MSLRSKLNESPDLWDFGNWGSLAIEGMRPDRRKKFLRNVKMTKSFLSGVSLTKSAKSGGVSKGYLSQMLKRALQENAQGEKNLLAALVPYRRCKKAKREMPVSMFQEVGDQGSWLKIFLDYPVAFTKFLTIVEKSIKRDRTAEVLNKSNAHRLLLRILISHGHNGSDFPFIGKRKGYVSFLKHYDAIVGYLTMPKPQWGKGLIKKRNLRPYDEIQIDEQLLDLMVSHDFFIDGRYVAARMSRISLALAIEVKSGAVIQFHLCLTSSPSHEDLIFLLNKLREPWKKRELLQTNLSYTPNAGFPTAVSSIYESISLGTIKLDNALAHHANRVRKVVCSDLHSTINLGRRRKPKDRNLVEGMFNIVNLLSHRYDSTTGSSPTDPIKESKENYKLPPVLNCDYLEEHLELLFTAYNARPHTGSDGFTPLEILNAEIERYPLPIDYRYCENRNSVFFDQEIVTIRQNKADRRRPHINFATLVYRGSCICSSNLVGKDVEIRFDIRDVRELEVLSLDGKLLGSIHCQKTRQGSKLSLRTLKHINRYCLKHKDVHIETVDDYFDVLSNKVDQPKVATELARLARELSGDSNLYPSESDVGIQCSDQEPQLQNRYRGSKRRAWKPIIHKKIGEKNEPDKQ